MIAFPSRSSASAIPLCGFPATITLVPVPGCFFSPRCDRHFTTLSGRSRIPSVGASGRRCTQAWEIVLRVACCVLLAAVSAQALDTAYFSPILTVTFLPSGLGLAISGVCYTLLSEGVAHCVAQPPRQHLLVLKFPKKDLENKIGCLPTPDLTQWALRHFILISATTRQIARSGLSHHSNIVQVEDPKTGSLQMVFGMRPDRKSGVLGSR